MALPQICALAQAICVLVAPGETYRADWQVYRQGRPVEAVCVVNRGERPAYIVARPRSGAPPEIELGEGLKFCDTPVS